MHLLCNQYMNQKSRGRAHTSETKKAYSKHVWSLQDKIQHISTKHMHEQRGDMKQPIISFTTAFILLFIAVVSTVG